MEQTINTKNEENREQVHVCPYCLQDVREGGTCPCLTEGDTDELPVKARIERLSPTNRQLVLRLVGLCENRNARRVKQKEVKTEDLVDPTTPPANSQKAIYSVPREELVMLKYGLSLETYEGIDEAVCALMSVSDQIKSDVKSRDVRTEGMITCIETHLQAVYDEMKSNRRRTVEAFNNCFPDDAINV